MQVLTDSINRNHPFIVFGEGESFDSGFILIRIFLMLYIKEFYNFVFTKN